METTDINNTALSDSQVDHVLETARDLSRSSDWVVFFREVLGLGGLVRRTFNSPDSLECFEQSTAYAEIQQILARLRACGDQVGDDKEPTRVITVRLPKSLHESLRAEAYERQTSMNKLCISKLVQMIDQELVPADGVATRR